MINPMMHQGVRIFENMMCLEKTTDPMRRHVKRPWMRDSYHARIQKKWIKRFGWVMKPAMFQTPQGFICHPAIAGQLRIELGRQQ